MIFLGCLNLDNRKLKMSKEQKSKIIYISVSTIVIWVITHGYRFMNNLYTCDALIEVFQDDILFQRSLGRFMHPLVMVMRGCISNPWFIGILSLFFMTASAYFIAEILNIDNPFVLILLSGLLICNNTLISSVAGFLPWMDVYTITLFLAVIGVWFYEKDKLYGYILGSISFVCCMGFYQAYIDVAFALFVIITVKKLAEKNELNKILLKTLKTVGALLASGISYYAVYKIVCKLHHINVTSSYHGLTQVSNFENTSLLTVFLDTYKLFFKFLFSPETFVSTILLGIRVSNVWKVLLNAGLVCCILAILAGLVAINIKNKIKISQIILEIIGLLLFPFAANFVCFMSKGIEHELMIYSFVFIYVFALLIIDLITKESKKKIYRYLLLIPFLIFIWNGFVYANQVYFKIDMEDRAAVSIATRIIDDIEDVEGYEAGVTPVRFVGALDRSDYMEPIIYLKDVTVNGNYNTPFTYERSLPFYLKYYLNVKINVFDAPVSSDALATMPCYPNEGSIQYVDDVLVIKISE